jgi:hypothetical protein
LLPAHARTHISTFAHRADCRLHTHTRVRAHARTHARSHARTHTSTFANRARCPQPRATEAPAHSPGAAGATHMRHIHQRSSSAAHTPVGLRAPALLPASARVCPRLPASAARHAQIARSSNPHAHPVTRPIAPPARAWAPQGRLTQAQRYGRAVGGRTREREREDRARETLRPARKGPAPRRRWNAPGTCCQTCRT